MKAVRTKGQQDHLVFELSKLAHGEQDRILMAEAIAALDGRYALSAKMAREPGVEPILQQLVGRIANAFEPLSTVQGKRILDLACGSNTSKAPAFIYINTPFGESRIRIARTEDYTAQFEPWFCRILLALGADPVGIDLGDLEGEAFEHYRVDLGQSGALDFLPNQSFDGVQDSRLFGSPEFTTQFPNPADRLKVAQEIRRQERRLLKPNGILIHSDAEDLVR
jgi:hypothetical protein